VEEDDKAQRLECARQGIPMYSRSCSWISSLLVVEFVCHTPAMASVLVHNYSLNHEMICDFQVLFPMLNINNNYRSDRWRAFGDCIAPQHCIQHVT